MDANDKSKRYQLNKILGEGQFAVVYRAIDTWTQKEIAVKKIKVGTIFEIQDGIHRTAIREIKFLKEMDHPNIVKLIDVYSGNNRHDRSIYMVFDFMSHDLEQIIYDRTIDLTRAIVKGFMVMLLSGLEHLHKNWILHRDLKPNNLLIASDGTLKIADFGLSRTLHAEGSRMTVQVVTRWYRAPELLMASQVYGFEVDVWAMGCIFAEMLLRAPLLPGNSDIDQLSKIFQVFGHPNSASWPDACKLPGYMEFIENEKSESRSVEHIFKNAHPLELGLLRKIMTLNPSLRLKTREMWAEPYFQDDLVPETFETLEKCVSSDIE